ncbi:MAG: hypothetical protein H6R26_664 [Proteobacteria bacterium]|nr:hypothetical protein [Pseudomonadota bacterium]
MLRHWRYLASHKFAEPWTLHMALDKTSQLDNYRSLSRFRQMTQARPSRASKHSPHQSFLNVCCPFSRPNAKCPKQPVVPLDWDWQVTRWTGRLIMQPNGKSSATTAIQADQYLPFTNGCFRQNLASRSYPKRF